MPRFAEPTFTEIELSELIHQVAAWKEQGYIFVQLCATTEDYGVELLYSFQAPVRDAVGLDGLLVKVPTGTQVPSITAYYPAAFVFENETHDLFGVPITDISIDFKGNFYLVSEKYPMNPKAADAEATDAPAEGEEVAHG